MDQRLVSALERRIEEGIAGSMTSQPAQALPLPPTPRTIHLMAKAAVSVYEAAVENLGDRGQGD